MNLSYHIRNQFFISFCFILFLFLNVNINQEAYSQPRVSLSASHLLRELKVDCKKNGLEVQLWFKQPFRGVAYSLGFYDKMDCRYIPKNSDGLAGGNTNYSFLIPVNGCGTTYGVKSFGAASDSMMNNSTLPMKTDEVHMENTLLIQGDAEIQEQGDLAQKLRCVWQKEIHKPLLATLPLSQGFQRIHPQRFHTQTQRKGNIEILPNSKKTWSKRSDKKDPFPYYNHHTVQKSEQSFLNINTPDSDLISKSINSQNEPKALAQIQTGNNMANSITNLQINSFLFTLYYFYTILG